MFRYLALIQFTDQGIRDVKHSTDRSHAFRAAVEAAGGRVIDLYWAIGEIDGAVIFEVPDEQKGASLLLRLGQEGHVRTRTARLFNAEEFAQVAQQT